MQLQIVQSLVMFLSHCYKHKFTPASTHTVPVFLTQTHYLSHHFFFFPNLISHYMLPEDTRSMAHCSFYPAISLGLLAGIQRLILPGSHGGPFHFTPNLIIPANASSHSHNELAVGIGDSITERIYTQPAG